MAASNTSAPELRKLWSADECGINTRRVTNVPKKRSIKAQSRSRSPSSIIVIAEESRLQLAATNVVNHYFGVVRQLRSRLWEADVMMLRSNSSDLTSDDFVGFAVTSQRKSSTKRRTNDGAKIHRVVKESILNCIVDVEDRIDGLRKELESKLAQLRQRGVKKARWQSARAADYASSGASALPTLPMKTSWPRLEIVQDPSSREIGVVEAPWEFQNSLSADAVFGRFYDVEDDELDDPDDSSNESDKRLHKSRSAPSSVGSSFLATVDEEDTGDWEDSVLRVESSSPTPMKEGAPKERQKFLSVRAMSDQFRSTADSPVRRNVDNNADTPSSTPRRYMVQTRSGQTTCEGHSVSSRTSLDNTLSLPPRGLRSLSPSPVANTTRRHDESQLPSVISMNSEWEDERGGDALMDQLGDSVWAEADAQMKNRDDSFFNVIDNDNNNNNQQAAQRNAIERAASSHGVSSLSRGPNVDPAPTSQADSTFVSDVSEEFDSDDDDEDDETTMMSSMFENVREPTQEPRRCDTKAQYSAAGDPSAHINATPASRSNANSDQNIQLLGTPPSWQPEPVDLSKRKKSDETVESCSTNEKADMSDSVLVENQSVGASLSTAVIPTVDNSVEDITSERKDASEEVARQVDQTADVDARKAVVTANAEVAREKSETGDTGAKAPILPSKELLDDLPGLICFSPFQMSFILGRGTKCIAFHDLMQKSVDNDNFVFQTIDPFTSEGQETVLEMILELDPSLMQNPDSIKSALTSNLACLATLRSKADYHAKLIGDTKNGKSSTPSPPRVNQPRAEADNSALSASRDAHDSGMASFDQSYSYLPPGPPQPLQPLPILTPFPIPPSAYSPWVTYSTFQTPTPSFPTLAPSLTTPAPTFQTPTPTPAFYASTPFVRPPFIPMQQPPVPPMPMQQPTLPPMPMQQPPAPPMVVPASLKGANLFLSAPKVPSSSGSGSLSPIVLQSPRSSFHRLNPVEPISQKTTVDDNTRHTSLVALPQKTTKENNSFKTAPVTLSQKTTIDDNSLKTTLTTLPSKTTNDDNSLKAAQEILLPESTKDQDPTADASTPNPLHVAISNVIGRPIPTPADDRLERLTSSKPKLSPNHSTTVSSSAQTVNPESSASSTSVLSTSSAGSTRSAIVETVATTVIPPFNPSIATISANQKPSPLASTIIAAQSEAFASAFKSDGSRASRASEVDPLFEEQSSTSARNEDVAEKFAVDVLNDVAGSLGESFGASVSAAFDNQTSRLNSRFPYSPASSSASNVTTPTAFVANEPASKPASTSDILTPPDWSELVDDDETLSAIVSESDFLTKNNYAMMPLPEISKSFEKPFRDSLESLNNSDFSSPRAVVSTSSSTTNTTSTESKPTVSYHLSPSLRASSEIGQGRIHSPGKRESLERVYQEVGRNDADSKVENKESTTAGPPSFASRQSFVPSLCDDIETPFHDDGAEQRIPSSGGDTTVMKSDDISELPSAYLRWVSAMEESKDSSPNGNDPSQNDRNENHPESGGDTLIITPQSFVTRQPSDVASTSTTSSSPPIAPSPDSGYRNTPTPEDGWETGYGRTSILKSKDIMPQISAAQRVASRPPLLPTPPARHDEPLWEQKPLFSKAASNPAQATLPPSTGVADDPSSDLEDDDLFGNPNGGDEWSTVYRKKRSSGRDDSATPEAVLNDDDRIIAASQQLIPTLSKFDSQRILEGIRRRNGGNLEGYSLKNILKVYKSKCFKTSLCYYYSKDGNCTFGTACTYAHGEEELRGPGKPSSVSLQRAAAQPTNAAASKSTKSTEPSRKPSPMKLVEFRPKGQLKVEKSSSSESASSGRYEDEDFYQGVAYSQGCEDSGEGVNESWETVSTKKKRSSDQLESGPGPAELDDETVVSSAQRILPKLTDFDARRILEGVKRRNGGDLVGYTIPSLMKIYKDKCFKTSLCLYYTKYGDCREGSECTYAHGKAELRGLGRPSSATIAAALAEQAGHGS